MFECRSCGSQAYCVCGLLCWGLSRDPFCYLGCNPVAHCRCALHLIWRVCAWQRSLCCSIQVSSPLLQHTANQAHITDTVLILFTLQFVSQYHSESALMHHHYSQTAVQAHDLTTKHVLAAEHFPRIKCECELQQIVSRSTCFLLCSSPCPTCDL